MVRESSKKKSVKSTLVALFYVVNIGKVSLRNDNTFNRSLKP